MPRSVFRRWCIRSPLALMALLSLSGAAATPWDKSLVVSNPELRSMRGRVLLPDGLDLDIGIDIQTEVNGVLVLHSVLSTAAPAGQSLRVFTGGAIPSNGGSTAVNLASAAPMLTLDRSGASTTLTTTSAPLTPTVVVLNAPTNVWPQYPDETQLNVTPNGPPVQTANGTVQVQQTGNDTAVVLNGNGLTVQQLFGDPTGTLVTNQQNNQAIQTTTVVDVDLHGTWPAITNAMFNIGNLAIAAARRP